MIASRCRPVGGLASGGGFFQCASSEMSLERYAKASSIRVRSWGYIANDDVDYGSSCVNTR